MAMPALLGRYSLKALMKSRVLAGDGDGVVHDSAATAAGGGDDDDDAVMAMIVLAAVCMVMH